MKDKITKKKRHATIEDDTTVNFAVSMFDGETVIGDNASIIQSIPPGTIIIRKKTELAY